MSCFLYDSINTYFRDTMISFILDLILNGAIVIAVIVILGELIAFFWLLKYVFGCIAERIWHVGRASYYWITGRRG